MSIELQRIDCNCNDCAFMERDFARREASLRLHEKWQKDYFEIMKAKLPENEQKKAKFQFDSSECAIHFGVCSNPNSIEWNKPISFIPNICQPHTQKCFKHRRS